MKCDIVMIVKLYSNKNLFNNDIITASNDHCLHIDNLNVLKYN